MGVIYTNGQYKNANIISSITQNCSGSGLDATVDNGNLILNSGSTTDFSIEDELLIVE